MDWDGLDAFCVISFNKGRMGRPFPSPSEMINPCWVACTMVKLFGRKVPKLNVTHFGQPLYARQPNIKYMHTCLYLCSLGCDWSFYRILFQQSSKQNCFCREGQSINMLQKAMLKSMLDVRVMSPTNHGSISPAEAFQNHWEPNSLLSWRFRG